MVVNININTTFFKTRHGLFKIVEFVRRRSVSTNPILSQVLVLVVLMIVRFDKNYQFGPVGDSGTSGIGESNFLATAKATLDKITSMGGGSGGGMGDGDFLGMVGLSIRGQRIDPQKVKNAHTYSDTLKNMYFEELRGVCFLQFFD